MRLPPRILQNAEMYVGTILFYTCSSNSLPQPEDQPEISDTALMSLGELFVRHGAHDAFGIHLLHAHFQIPIDTALCGAQVKISDNSESCWTKPLLAKELATRTKPRLNSLSGHRAL
ncbi:hypothetical protein J3458_016856 [Metarhizium acridum]|uniref:uncharacterized protein n=1 Tax=Metarhizium acridum TaxID=92637 RepID=UPI001C6B7BDE|nr:hypothetical protein J3458_016856 [Metarhizium acridum]